MYNPIAYTAEYESLRTALSRGKGPLSVTGPVDSAKAMLIGAWEASGWMLVVTRDERRAKQLARDIRSFQENSYYYPARDFLFYQADTQGTLITRQRVDVLKHMLEEAGGVIVTTVDALMDKIEAREVFQQAVLTIEPGQVIEINALILKLQQQGYERLPEVDAMGQFAVRGGIVDVYPFTAENPVRIEFWDTEVDNLRSFSPESQRSLEGLDRVEIYPAQDRSKGAAEGRMVSLLDYFPAEAGIFLDEPDRLRERALAVQEEFTESFEARREQAERHGKLAESLSGTGLQEDPGEKGAENPAELIYTAEETLERLCTPFSVGLSALGNTLSSFPALETIRMDTAEVPSYKNGFEMLVKDLQRWQSEQYELLLLSPSRTRASRLAQELRDYEIRAYCPDEEGPGKNTELSGKLPTGSGSAEEMSGKLLTGSGSSEEMSGKLSTESGSNEDLSGKLPMGSGSAEEESGKLPGKQEPESDRIRREANKGSVQVRYGFLHAGFLLEAEKLVILTESDMFGNAGEVKKKRKQKSYEGQKIAKLSEISAGDYVVHESHGIGIYRGIERITTDGITKDYMKVEYGDGGNLYLPATRLEGLQKYAGSDAKKPRLNKLNGNEWQKTRSRVQSAVREIARDLVQLYASRQSASGFRFSQDTVWQKEFEELFPYEETADQVLAIEATKEDMESRKIMDRLICGDVGYGKTEIALRAAFKSVQDSKQVAYLVPTTILAQQIYNTFVERMKGFPVRVELLCRFRTPQQIRKSIADIKAGRADVVIGTHRLLSGDVAFRDLGLLIVDEEQRFGVTHKEKIKNLKRNVDVLTLTATPIPRTLHMSLVGIRDMSVLEEPPMDRVPIQTYVMEYNDELVREAISRELARGGQVYYVHNRVASIELHAQHVQQLIPEARVAFAHGKMSETKLEEIMLRFINGEIDVLVSTTIIETGLDIPNANTLIVADADRMGLSQLYQLRGRVGRSSRTAYAFLMYRRGKLLTEESEKRLKAIREFTQLGSGIRIAMRDLEIRGAGNVLGAEQHGHMEAVGYDLYCKLLNHAVQQEKGLEPEQAEAVETQIDCDIDAFIPDSYIPNESQKLEAYKRISSITSQEDYMDTGDELTDRYGEPPVQVENLLRIARLRALASQCGILELTVGRGSFRALFSPGADIRAEELPGIITMYNGQLKFSGGNSPTLTYRSRERSRVLSVVETIDGIESILLKIRKEGS